MKSIRIALAIFGALFVVTVGAQQFPTKPVRLLVGYPPGGGMDGISRVVAARASEQTGQTFLVENRPGASGSIAGDVALKAPSDGYTLYIAETGLLILPAVSAKMAFDVHKQFTPVASLATLPLAIVVNPSVNARTAEELAQLLKQNPGRYSFGSPGVGTLQHLAMELFLKQAGADAIHVPYRGANPMIPDLINGQVPIGVISATPALAQSRAGKLRTIALTGATRIASAPDWRTLAETYPGFDAAPRVFVLAPQGTPEPVVTRLAEIFRAALAAPDVIENLGKQGASAQWSDHTRLAADIRAESSKWIAAAKSAGLKPE